MKKVKYIWRERKRNAFGLPWSFTVYTLTEDKFLVSSGAFNKVFEEVLLYRVIDLTVKCSFLQRIFGLGTIHCCTHDKTTPEFNITNIRQPLEVKEMLSKAIEEARVRKGYTVRELMGVVDDDDNGANDGCIIN